MGLEGTVSHIYVNIAFGRIRMKASKDDPKAVERKNKSGESSWGIEYQSISGVLDDVKFRTHEEYGNSWNVFIKDGTDNYCLQISEDSRFGVDFLKKLPNLHRGEPYKFTPYDYEKDKKRKIGLSIVDGGNNKVQSFYEKFTEKGDKWEVELLHGFPTFTGNSKDKDDLKIYFTQVAKFLRTQAQEFLKSKFSIIEEPKAETTEAGPESDLPF